MCCMHSQNRNWHRLSDDADDDDFCVLPSSIRDTAVMRGMCVIVFRAAEASIAARPPPTLCNTSTIISPTVMGDRWFERQRAIDVHRYFMVNHERRGNILVDQLEDSKKDM